MSFELYVKEWRLFDDNGTIVKVPIYGNFCPNCCGPSDKIYGYQGGLVYCTLCNHTFQMQDMKNKVLEFGKRQRKGNQFK